MYRPEAQKNKGHLEDPGAPCRESQMANIEVPLGVLTAFVGTPLFLWQLATARRGWQ